MARIIASGETNTIIELSGREVKEGQVSRFQEFGIRNTEPMAGGGQRVIVSTRLLRRRFRGEFREGSRFDPEEGVIDLPQKRVTTEQVSEAPQKTIPVKDDKLAPFKQPTFISKTGTTQITRQGGVSVRKPPSWYSYTPQARAIQREKDISDVSRIYEKATPQEQLGLRTKALLSPRGWEFIGSGVGQYFGKKTPKDVTISYMLGVSKLQPITETQTYLTRGGVSPYGFTYKQREVVVTPEEQTRRSAVFENPFTELGMLYVGGKVLGVASRVPKVVSFLSTGTRAQAVGDIGKVAGGVYVAAESVTAGQYFAKDEYAKGFGTVFRTTGTLGAISMGFKSGEKAGELIRIRREALKLGKVGEITPSEAEIITVGTRTSVPRAKFLREPEAVDVISLKGVKQQAAFKEIRPEEEIFGGIAQEVGMIEPIPRIDIDVAVRDVTRIKPLKEAGVKDVKDIEMLRGFMFREPPIKTPAGRTVTSYRESYMRKLSASVDPQRLARKGKRDILDVQRFLKAERPKGLSERIQRYTPQRDVIRDTTRLKTDYSYLPQRTKITPSYLPSSPRITPSILPSAPSKPSGVSVVPSRPPLVPSRPSAKDYYGLPPSRPPSKPPSRPSYRPPSRPSYAPSSRSFLKPSEMVYSPTATITPPKKHIGYYMPEIPEGIRRARKKRKGEISLRRGYAPSLIGVLSPVTLKEAPKVLQTGVGVRYRVKKKK